MKQLRFSFLFTLLFCVVTNSWADGTCGDNLTWTYDDETKTLTISGTGAMYDYWQNLGQPTTPWHEEGYKDLEHVIIEEGVTSIGKFAFLNCVALSSVQISKTVFKIDLCAFENCGLTSVIIPEGVSIISEESFANCTNLSSVFISEGVTTIDTYAFRGCSAITSITIPSSVNIIGTNPFSGCSSLEAIHVDADNATYDSRNHCNAIIETEYNVLISGCCNTIIPDGITGIGRSAFKGCTGLTSVIIPSSVNLIIENPFADCSGLELIKVDSGNTTYDSRNHCNAIINKESNTLITGCINTIIPNNITEIGIEAFRGCVGLASLTLPNSVSSIGHYVFYDCINLSSIVFGNNLTKIGDRAFRHCSSLSNVYCYTEQVPSTLGSFDASIKQATLHVPAATIQLYSDAEEWKDFGNIIALKDTDPVPTTIMNISHDAKIRYSYSLDGKCASILRHGLMIVKKNDGSRKKIIIK